jgi:hypothetical protein
MRNLKNKIQKGGEDPIYNHNDNSETPASSSSSSPTPTESPASPASSESKPPTSTEKKNGNGKNGGKSNKNTIQKTRKSSFERKSQEIRKMHSEGKLSEFISELFSTFGSYLTLLIMILTLPAMPVIFYLTILYNVIILTWEKFKNLDTYPGAK